MSTPPKTDVASNALAPQSPPDRTGAGLWIELRQAILEEFDLFERAAVSLLSGTLSEDARQHMAREAHKMVGSCGVLGMNDGVRISRELEHMLQKDGMLGEPELLQISNAVVGLRRLLEQEPALESLLCPPNSAMTVLLIDADQEFATRLALEALNLGLQMTIANSADAARIVIAQKLPDCIMLDPYLAEGREGGFAILSELAGRHPALPIICFSGKPSFEDRIEAAHRGARLLLQKPISPAEAIEFAQREIEAEVATRATAFAISSEPLLLNNIKRALKTVNVRLLGLTDPVELWKPSQMGRPELLILDGNLQTVDPLHLCRVLQNDPLWSAVPVMVLVAGSLQETTQEFISAGADDCVMRYFEPAVFAARVRQRIRRSWKLRVAAADKSTLLGAALSHKSMSSAQTRKGKETWSLVDMEIDHLERVIERHGVGAAGRVHRRLAQLLRERFHCEHLVTRWRGDEFVFEVQELPSSSVLRDASVVLKALRDETFVGPSGEQFQVTASAGIAQYGTGGADYRSLYDSAHAALMLAHEAGGDQTVTAASHAEQSKDPTVLDVLVVDDDPAVGRVLVHALETGGFRVKWLRNGTKALDELMSGEAKPRVILLDVGLPGLDGFSVLKQLMANPAVSSTRVIMLTARSGEEEVLKALEWGAFDHVSKPFSLQVLVQRVRRALEA